MNYLKIYYQFLEDFKNTPVRQRISRRDQHDPRLLEDKIYTELHHIIPKAQGGTDEIHNLVRILPEEHIFIHFIRWKLFRSRNDLIAVNFMINGFFNKQFLSDITLNKVIRKKYSIVRREFGKVISKVNKGSTAISNARKGKMPVKDAITGEIIGSIPIDHENIKSGKWVHITKGRRANIEERSRLKLKNIGHGNPNHSGISDEDYILIAAEYVKTQPGGRFIKTEFKRYCEENGLKYIKSFSENRFGGKISNFVIQLRDYCDKNKIEFKFDRYYRGLDVKNN